MLHAQLLLDFALHLIWTDCRLALRQPLFFKIVRGSIFVNGISNNTNFFKPQFLPTLQGAKSQVTKHERMRMLEIGLGGDEPQGVG